VGCENLFQCYNKFKVIEITSLYTFVILIIVKASFRI